MVVFWLLFSNPDDAHPVSSFQKGMGKIGKVPPQFIHNLERLPHVGRIDSDGPLVLFIIPSLYQGLGARFDAVNRKGEGEEREDHMLANSLIQLSQTHPFTTHQGHLCQSVLFTTGPEGKEITGSGISSGSSSAKCTLQTLVSFFHPALVWLCGRSLFSISPSLKGYGVRGN